MSNLLPAPNVGPIPVVRDGTVHTLAVPAEPSYAGHYRLLVNGQVVVWSGYNKPVMVSVEGEPTAELFRSVSVAVRWNPLTEGEEPISNLTHDLRMAGLLGKSTLGREGDRCWRTLEDEVAYKRFERGYVQETRTEWVKVTDLELMITDKVPEVSWITPARMIGGSYMDTTAAYDRMGFMLATLKEALAREGLNDGKGRNSYSLFSHNRELSLHLPGGFHRKQAVYPVTDQYRHVLALRDADRMLVEGWVREWVRCFNSPVNAAEVISDVQTIRGELARIKVYASHSGERNGLLKRLDALVDKLNTSASGDDK